MKGGAMKPEVFLKFLEENTGITPLKFSSDGIISLIFNDNYTVHLKKSEDDYILTVFGIIGKVPDNDSELCLLNLLDANLFGRGTGTASIGVNVESKEIIIFEKFSFNDLEQIDFVAKLKGFLNTQEHWTTLISSDNAGSVSNANITHQGSQSLGSPFLKI